MAIAPDAKSLYIVENSAECALTELLCHALCLRRPQQPGATVWAVHQRHQSR
jgi:hypothetical protein